MPNAFWFLLSAIVSLSHAAPRPAPLAASGSLYPERSTAPVIVVYPAEGAAMPLSEGEFIFGSVSDPKAPFHINDATVTVRPNGAFLAWLPISSGTFVFRCGLDLDGQTTFFTRTIYVAAPPPPLPEKPLAIDEDSLWPKSDVELRPGDWIPFRARASPGHKVRCRLGERPWQDMREAGPGIYEGMQAVNPGDSLPATAAECRIPSGWSPIRSLSRGKVSLSSDQPAVAVVKNNAVMRTSPDAGYMAFPLPGTRLITAGRAGAEFKVRLSPALDGWIEAKDVDLLPPGSPLPRAVTGAIRTSASEHETSVHITLSERAAFSVDEDDGISGITVRIFNCVGHTNWIVYDSNDPFVEEIRWKQESSDVVALKIRLNAAMTLWGWQAAFEGSSLKLSLRRAPVLAPAPASPLKGLTVVLDPGHMPSAQGAIGPMGTREMDANFAIASDAFALLAKRGALPVLTRATMDQEVGLAERSRFAVERKGDIFVSIHNNALSDGENPFAKPHGYSVFYYHPHSLALARHIYRSYEKRVPLPGEDMRYGNLLVARLSAMPAILIESAYMIIPEHEEKLNDPGFRHKLAEAIADGLESFLEKERAKQQPRAEPQPPVIMVPISPPKASGPAPTAPTAKAKPAVQAPLKNPAVRKAKAPPAKKKKRAPAPKAAKTVKHAEEQ